VSRDPQWKAIAGQLTVTAQAEIDRLYPRLRPARVTVTTARGNFTRQADDALGSRLVPLSDAGLKAKFHELVTLALGSAAAASLAETLWAIETVDNVAPLVEAMASRNLTWDG